MNRQNIARLRYRNPYILMDVVFGRASLRWALRHDTVTSAAEIGVQQGINSKTILRRARPRRMVCADPWSGYSSELDMPMEHVERVARKRLDRYKHIEWIKSGNRNLIAAQIGNSAMDYLYIDAMHDYDSVMADMRAYWPCVKVGGMMAGHDVVWPSVFRAVADFRREHNVDVQCSGTDWWIIRPNETLCNTLQFETSKESEAK